MLFARAKKSRALDAERHGRAQPAAAGHRPRRDGYAIAVSTTDPSLLLRPDVVGATQAAVVDDGPASPAAAVVGDGPQTTGLYAAQAARAAAEQARGLQYQWLLQGAPFPQFELRLADGGALVLYGMYLNTTNEHPNLAAGSPIPVSRRLHPAARRAHRGRVPRGVRQLDLRVRRDRPARQRARRQAGIIASQRWPSYGHAY